VTSETPQYNKLT